MERLKKILRTASQHGNPELNRIDYLDGWRGMAITCVLLSHFLSIKVFDLGRMGVDIFFVLSGMLMSNILFVKRLPLTKFYKRRISRILPVFIIYVSLICLLSYIFDLSRSNEHENYFYIVFFLRSYLPETAHIFHTGIPIGHIWSLNVEEHSYIILSLLTLISILKKKEFFPLLITGVCIIFLHYIYLKHPELTSGGWDLKTEIVASHLFISAGYFLIKDKFNYYVHSWMPVLSLFLGVLCYWRETPSLATWVASPFLLAFTVNHLDSLSEKVKKVLSNKWLCLVGIYSYSIYLWQQPFYYYGVKFKEMFPFAGLVFLITSIVIGIISFYCIENPIRKYLNNRW